MRKNKSPFYFIKFLLLLLCSYSLIIVKAQTKSKYKKLVWADEFNYEGLPDSSKWSFEVGLVRNKEPQYYTDKRLKNCEVKNGLLTITAYKEKFEGSSYTSSSIHTQGKAEFKYGRMEMRAKMPKGIGSWPAFWMLGKDHGRIKWPDCGEIDIVEYVGKDSSQVYGTVHYADDKGKYHMEGLKPKLGNPSDGFHIYAVEWDKYSIRWYYDSTMFFHFDYKNVDDYAKSILQNKYYLLVNLALGRSGTLGGPLHDNILPLTYDIDYVRVYQ